MIKFSSKINKMVVTCMMCMCCATVFVQKEFDL